MVKTEVDFSSYEAHKRNFWIDAGAFGVSLIFSSLSAIGMVDTVQEKANPLAYLLAFGLSLLFTIATGRSMISERQGMRRKRPLK